MPPITTSIADLTRLLAWVEARGGTLDEVAALHAALAAAELRLQNVFVGSSTRVSIAPISDALAFLSAVIQARQPKLARNNYRIGQAKERLDVLVRIFSRELRSSSAPETASYALSGSSAAELAQLMAQNAARMAELAKPPPGRDRQFFVSELGAQTLPLLRALWSLTVKPQEETPFPRTKAEALQDLASYYLQWHHGDAAVLAEHLEEAREFGAERTTLREIKRQRDE